MKIVDIKQNTLEWEEFREDKIGGSDCPYIVGKSPFGTVFDLWEKKMHGKKTPSNSAMQRGSLMEPIALDYYTKKYSISGNSAVVQHERIPYMMASLDGLFKDHILEIKCPGKKVLDEAKQGKPQEYWIWQMQHNLEVATGMDLGIILVYDEDNPEESPVFEIMRDEDMISHLQEAEAEFYRRMIELDPPELPVSHLVERKDEEYLEAEGAWKKSKEALEQAVELEKICREGLIYLSGDRSSKGLQTALLKVFVRGKIDYSKIPELQGVDLDKYRKPGYSCWKIRIL